MGDYPSEKEVISIKNMEMKSEEDFFKLLDAVKNAWCDYGSFTSKGRRFRLATGGWSGNEEIIGAMMENRIFWFTCWELSQRGGLHKFIIPKIAKTKPSQKTKPRGL